MTFKSIPLLIPILLLLTIQLNDAFSVSRTPPAYILIEAKLKQSEMERFSSYASKVPLIVEKYGGEYIVLGRRHEPLEGEWGETKVVLHKWPNAEMAKRFWESDEYREIKKIREGTGEFRIMMVEGLEKNDLPEL
mmetsp:Transcript_44101/g.64815  ORF Transcript_44101/g.64815 Transcript_44101/m.64815 type:complete len:135 (-) Transcript_44101:359-763(-)